MSVLDRQPPNMQACFGLCLGQEHRNLDIVKPQRELPGLLSTEEDRKKKAIDSMLSEAMNELTFEERQRQQEVLHGVEDDIIEEATFIEAALEQLDSQLTKMKRGSIYEMAEQMDAAYVQAKAFRVMFLRSNGYNVKGAADQMLLFFKAKLDLFGPEKLVKEITMEDLDEDDRASLETGWAQSVGKDRSDRIVALYFPGLRDFKELRNELRAMFFFRMKLMQSYEEAQLKGVVEITYTIGKFRDKQNGTGYSEHSQMIKAIPWKNAAIHLCLDNMSEYLLYNVAIKLLPAKQRSVFRLHFGSHIECQYRLSTYGVSSLLLPLDFSTGAIKLARHKVWLQSCLAQVEPTGGRAASPSQIIIASNDVLYGGKCHYNHMGNQHLRTLAQEWSQVYDSATNETKRIVVDKIIHEIHLNGGRFLKGENGVASSWQIVPQDKVRKKITQMFRNRRRKRRLTPKDDSS